MSDPRLTPDPARQKEARAASVITPLTELRRSPKGPRDRQLLYGDEVTVWSTDGAHSYVTAEKDGYCGFVLTSTLAAPTKPTHIVSAPATHAYARPDFKSRYHASLSFGSRVAATGTEGRFAKTELGHIPLQHLAAIDSLLSDPCAIAESFLGTPYLWGGNSRFGIDCSGLVQAALLACGLPCPGDSDLQMSLGAPAGEPYCRNDLLFWKGHVALVCDQDTLIHANAHSMMVNHEPIADAITRIAQSGDGPVTAHRRLPALSG